MKPTLASPNAATPSPDQALSITMLDSSPQFANRHIGPDAADIDEMLGVIGTTSLDDLMSEALPSLIRTEMPLGVGAARSEHDLLESLAAVADRNQVRRTGIGMGYFDTMVPAVIQRNVLENPSWYTQYTPYQSEISQGRLEALLNFQTMISDLTGLPVANASLLDEATAAAEAMIMCRNLGRKDDRVFLVSDRCHPQTLAVLRGRAAPLGIELRIESIEDSAEADLSGVFGVLLQYPDTDGRLHDWRGLIEQVHAAGAHVVMATDPLALAVITPPGELGADIAIGSAQRFGVPMGYGGPHAAFISTKESFVRKMPGRIIGLSRDRSGRPALRMAIQTREQHIKRDRATSNICTAQVLLAIMASMYAVYHGPQGIQRISTRVALMARGFASALRRCGREVAAVPFFDTVRVDVAPEEIEGILGHAIARGFNLRRHEDGHAIGVSFDETTTEADVHLILEAFNRGEPVAGSLDAVGDANELYPEFLRRTSSYLEHPVFNSHHSETEMLRYITSLQERDLSLANSMIPLGSCTMKLNATAEMLPVTWPGFSRLHPFAPLDQAEGYLELFRQLESWLCDITGFSAVSLQPNAGSQGEFAGLMVIRAWHEHRGDTNRDICLIPTSAHGTNPASAIAAGFRVVAVKTSDADICLDDLRAKIAEHGDRIGAVMVTYPSTHGVFEDSIREIANLVHEAGGQVYLDGANMNAMVGLCRPAELGADVCHLNLHKTFCIPHGGGGPGMGPIGVAAHLGPFLPGHPVVRPETAGEEAIEAISAAPWGSPSILPISWMYIALMGNEGLRHASEVAILNANYMASRLKDHYDILYLNANGRCAHEFILDCRPFSACGVRIDDVAKRLMDYGFHSPTMSWPVAGTLMVEPTESESREELDRFCDAMIGIREEIRAIEKGEADKENNVLHNAPHSLATVTADEWPHPYSREQAAYPAAWLRDRKFWPPVDRVDNPFGDRNLVCTCPSVESLERAADA
ncbi:MAG: aminomethyl-transferring glycine dehydrogenase [Phycisphaerales bacterium]|nr:aminomethyl-transferring glycine dehydrogenase [Phycisphaerales bacterium]